MELFVQMVIIFGGNQFIQQIMEFYMPLFWKCKSSSAFSLSTAYTKYQCLFRAKHAEVQHW